MAKNRSIDFEQHRRAQEHIAQGSLTNSKRPECFVMGVYPTHVTHGLGPYLIDVHGHKYIDFICGLGSNILGYANVQIVEAVKRQAEKGATFSLGSVLEIELAEKIKQVVPFAQKMRFLKTGTEACMAALKIARAKTGRHEILTDGYHGWHDEFISLSPPALGVAPQTSIKKFTSFDEITEKTAAVIIEPVMTDNSDARIQWLRELRAKCTKTGTVLIFDEIITGFRYPKFTVSYYHGITPDIICLGKAIANGMPLSVVAGSSEVMNCGEYFVSSTFAGETVSMAAAMKTIELLQTKHHLEVLMSQAAKFCKEFNELAPELVRIEGYGTRGVFQSEIHNKAIFWQEAVRAGILFGSSFFFNFAHIEVMDSVLSACRDILVRMKSSNIKLMGQLPTSPFAQKIREKSQ